MKKLLAVLTTICIVGSSLPAVYSGVPEYTVTAFAADHGDAFQKHDNQEVPYDNSFYKDTKKGIDPDSSSIHPKLTIDKLEVPLNEIGTKQRVALKISGADGEYNCFGLHLFHDNRLVVNSEDDIIKGEALSQFAIDGIDLFSKSIISDVSCYVGGIGGYQNGEDGDIAYIDFTIPENAKIGDLYPIGIEYFSNEYTEDCFTNSKIDQCMESWFFTYGIENGYIKIVRPINNEGYLTFLTLEDHAELIECDKAASGDIVIPSEFNGVPVTQISEKAFENCTDIKSVKIPDTVTSIGDAAFKNCQLLETVDMGNSVISIGADAFEECYGIKSLKLSDSVTSIGDSAFYKCKILESIDMGDSMVSIGQNAFQHCRNLNTIMIPGSVSEIGKNAFDDTKWLSDRLSEGEFVIINGILIKGSSDLWWKDIVIPDSVTTVNDCAIDGINIRAVVFPDTLKSIRYEAFYDTAVSNVEIPESVTYIGEKAFGWCRSLKIVTIYNPECYIYDDILTFYTTYDDVYSEYILNCTIRGYDNSTAQAYAEKYGYKFESLGEVPTTESATTESATDVNTVSLDVSELTLETGQQYTLKANQSGLIFKSSNSDVAVVSKNSGVITAIDCGNAIISAINSDGDVAQVRVTVVREGQMLKKGDANGDETVDMADVVMVMQACLNPKKYGVNGTSPDRITADGEKAGDVDGNAGLTANDALIIQRYSLKLIDTL